jgi:hypothetical protein
VHLLFLLACSDATNDRAAWLRETLLRADAPYWSRPKLLADKYAVMATHPYDFYRGSLPLYLAEQARPGDRDDTAFLTTPQSAEILLFGDAHPENLGTLLPDDALATPDALRIEVTDLDAASYGPWLLDLRRAALGIALLGDGFQPFLRDAAVSRLPDGWLNGLGTGGLDPSDEGRILQTLRVTASIEGASGERLADWTEDGRFVRDAQLIAGEGLIALDPGEAAELDALLSQGVLPDDARVLDRVRRYGVGVASRPAIRYLVLWDRGSAGIGDDQLVQLREVVEPVRLPGAWPARFDDPASRVVDAAAALWVDPGADPRLGSARVGPRGFKVQSADSFFQGLDRGDVDEGFADDLYGPDDLGDLAYALGYLMGSAHSRAPTASGADATPVLLDDVAQRRELLRDELVGGATSDLAQLYDDYALFTSTIADDPLLGLGSVR